MDRRQFLIRTGWIVGAGALAAAGAKGLVQPQAALQDWAAVRDQFALTRDRIHMSGFLLSAHPKPVREAIARHRRGLDENTVEYLHANELVREAEVLAAAAGYLDVDPTDIALTDSTTMGLGLLYGGLSLQENQEILTTTHDHYSTEISLKLRAERTGASVRRILLYQDIQAVSKDEIVETLIQAVRPQTRIVALTWVHSSTGLKLPIRQIADALAAVNARRDEADRALLCVDGVHGIGVEDETLAELGCDFFVAGTHKWLFGPRGTGLVWGKRLAWASAHATIPTFDRDAYLAWMKVIAPQKIPLAAQMTPGGFHAFEHRWALGQAFAFHQAIGKERVQQRVHALNHRLKEALSQMPHVVVYTPIDDALSSGIVCFDVRGRHATQVVDALEARGIVATITPYATIYARLAPGLLTSEDEVDRTIEAVAALG